jgi:fatty acid desaturase
MVNHSDFSLPHARRIVHSLFQPKPAIFWLDFTASLIVGYGAAAIYLEAPALTLIQACSFIVAVFSLYRISLFMHEIVHFKTRDMKSFRLGWNILAGVPMLTPSFFYESHIAHHNTRHYGTRHDGEYLPLGHGRLYDVLAFLAQVLIQPIFVTLRFLLAPMTFLHPKLRQWTLERASSFVINFHYRREIPADANRAAWAAMDLACSLRAWVIFIAPIVGLTAWTRVPQLYAIAVTILTLNHLRTLSAHRYLGDGDRMSHSEQFFDSTIITGNPLTSLICPLGQRYHGLHHLFPSLPYHNLAAAHRLLSKELPADSPYHDAVYPTYFSVFREMREHFRNHQNEADAMKQKWYTSDVDNETLQIPPMTERGDLSASA